mgnify:CR=1 FL=1
MPDQSRPRTLGELRASGYTVLPVREEMRRNLIARLRSGEPIFDGVIGYEETVLPQIENAILAGQDIIFLGERGQAKTRMARSLVNLLDVAVPIVAGSEINDDPFEPISRYAIDLVAEKGDDTPIEWIGRDRRHGPRDPGCLLGRGEGARADCDRRHGLSGATVQDRFSRPALA